MTSRTIPLLTVADLDTFPDDEGNRYELIGGELFVTSVPEISHQRILQKLAVKSWRVSESESGWHPRARRRRDLQ